MAKPRVVIVDDVEDGAYLDANHLRDRGYDVEVLTHPADLQQRLEQPRWWRATVVLLDMNFSEWVDGPEDGFEVLRALDDLCILGVTTEVVIYLEDASFDQANDAWELGACAYVPRSDDYRPVVEKIERAHKKLRLRSVRQGAHGFMEKVGALASARAPSSALLLGEPGVGKSHYAKMIHFNSAIKDEPFVEIDLGGLDDNLMNVELFGSVEGAFTGAIDKEGLLARAGAGTAFFDELGDLSLSSQGKLRRVLQERKARKVGDVSEYHVAARFIFATNVDLERAVAEGKFRRDLYGRLPSGWKKVTIPPLRERPDDILRLAGQILAELEQARGGGIERMSREAQQLLLSYNWPDNVRELEQVIKNTYDRMVERSMAGTIEARHVDLEVRDVNLAESELDALLQPPWDKAVAGFERLFWERLILKTGSKTKAAELAGRARSSVYRRMGKLGSKGSTK